jgi:hypothetical protein
MAPREGWGLRGKRKEGELAEEFLAHSYLGEIVGDLFFS